jgi:hypothetical protein
MGQVHSKRISGNYVEYQDHEKRLVDARGVDVVKYFEDFINPLGTITSDALPGWTTTLVEAGAGESTVTLADASGGAVVLTTDDADNDGINLQMKGESFGFASSQKATYFGIRFKASEATQDDFLVGLCITDTTLLGGLSDGVYFRKVDASAAVEFVTEKDSTETATASVLTFVADTYYVMEFYFDGTSVEAFIDGVRVAQHTANIPDDELLTPSIHFLAGEAVVKTMTVDWVRAIQIGR